MGNSDVSQAKGHESVANHRRCNNPQLDWHWLIGFHAKPFGEHRIISTFQGFFVLAGTRPSGDLKTLKEWLGLRSYSSVDLPKLELRVFTSCGESVCDLGRLSVTSCSMSTSYRIRSAFWKTLILMPI